MDGWMDGRVLDTSSRDSLEESLESLDTCCCIENAEYTAHIVTIKEVDDTIFQFKLVRVVADFKSHHSLQFGCVTT